MAKKILVVDDDPEIHGELEGLLREQIGSGQVDLLAAYDARSALSCLLDVPEVDILFLDIGLPDINGLTLLKELQQLEGFFSVVMLTGNQGREVILDALHHGAIGFLTKPVRRNDLQVMIDRAMDHSRKKRSLLQNEAENNFLRILNERLNREIKEREKIQGELKILTAALEQSADSIVVTDRDGLIRYVNRGYTHITGYSSEEAIGKTPRILKSGKQPLEFYEKLWECITDGYTFSGELINRRKNGEIYWEDKTITPIRDAVGEIVFFVSTGKDKTEKKRIERLREDTERIMQHDMKNPLNGIVGFAEILLESDMPADQREMVQYIRDAGLELTNMMNHSLDIFKMEEGTYRIEEQKVSLASVAQVTLAMFSNLATQRRVTLSLDVPKNLPSVIGSLRHLQGMCYNLVKNAIEASASGDQVRVWLEHEGNRVLLKVWNQLPVPEEIRDRFFDRYVTSGKEKGSGLGTYSARLIARVHGGDLRFTSSREDGTTLVASLPVWRD